jgi:putrescine aminotransferase
VASSALPPLADLEEVVGGSVGRDRAKATLARLKRHVSPGAALGFKVLGGGATEETASGATVVLSDGRRLLDFGSYGVTLLGHRHPAILAALADELEQMPTATRSLANPTVAAFAAEVVERCGDSLQRVWLGSNGSDVVELSLKLARRRSGRMRILVVEGAFHGKTLGALSLTTNPVFRAGLEPLLGEVSELPREDPEAVLRETARGDVAALVFEPIQGEAGVRPLDPAVLQRWAADAHAAGSFVISDEVQVGLGRCGPFSPSIAAGLEPDAVLLGKALGGGLMPLSAMVATDVLAAPLIADPTWHTMTFGGHPLGCAAGRAALVALEEAAVHGAKVSEMLRAGLGALSGDHPDTIVEVRGTGLIWGIEFSTAGTAGAALLELARRGLLVSPCLSAISTIRLLPPMVVSADQVEQGLEILAATLPSLGTYL